MGTGQDIDMRLLPLATTTTTTTATTTSIPPTPLAEITPVEPTSPTMKPRIDTIASPPQESFIDYSQYLRDAKMTLKDLETTNSVDKNDEEDHQGDTSNVEDELDLQIDESRSPSIRDDESEKNSDDENDEEEKEQPPPQPPSYFELLPPTIYTDSKLGSLSKIDLSSTVTQLLNPFTENVPTVKESIKEEDDEEMAEEEAEKTREDKFEEKPQPRITISKDPRIGSRDPRAEQLRDPRNNDYLQRLHDNRDQESRSSSPSDNENVSSNVSDGGGGGGNKKNPTVKQSMYDYDEDEDRSNDSNISTKSDKDMRLDYLRDHDGRFTFFVVFFFFDF